MKYDIREIIKVYDRVCETCTSCSDCSMFGPSVGACKELLFTDTEKFLDLLYDWEKKHPLMTNKEAFLNLLPDKPWQKFNPECVYGGSNPCKRNLPCPACSWWDKESDFKQ